MDKDKFNTYEHKLFELSMLDQRIGELKKQSEEILEFFYKQYRNSKRVSGSE